MESESQVGQGSKKGKLARYFAWNNAMDRVLSTTLIDQLNKGNKLDGKLAWKKEAWTAAVNSLKEQLGVDVTKQNIQSRLKTWDKHYGIISEMLESGFSWDNTRGTIHVSDVGVWNAYVKEHREVIPYRKKISLENWDDICTLFAQDRAIGEGAQAAFEAPRQLEANEESNNLEETSRTIGSHDGVNDDATNVLEDQHGRSNAPSSSHSHSRKRKQRSSYILDATNVLEDTHGRSNAPSSSHSHSQKRKQRSSYALHSGLRLVFELYFEPSKVTAKMVLQEVSKVQGLDQTQLFKAIDLMMHDPKMFEIFSDLPNDMKKPYILMHLNQ